MTLAQGLSIATAVGQLGLGLLCVARMRHGPLALPLGALCFMMFGFSLAEWAYEVSRVPAFGVLDVTLSSATAPFALYFILAFIGARRRLRPLLWAVSAPFVVLALACARGLVFEPARAFSASPLRGHIQGALIVLLVLVGTFLLVRHERDQPSVLEKMRTRLVLGALFIGGAMGAADVLGMRLPLPSMLITTGLLAVVALRFRLFDTEPSRLAVVYAFAIATVAMLGYLLAFRLHAGATFALVIAVVVISALLTVGVWQVVTAVGARRAELERLAVLGRFSAQLAHDLKNPLAALRGAAQVLQQERTEGRSIDEQHELLALLVAEAERLTRTVDRYQRLGRLDLVRERTDVNALVRRVVSLRLAPSGGAARIELDLAADLPPVPLDSDLVTATLDNLVQNALDAVGSDGSDGRVTLRTAMSDEPSAVVIGVHDHGRGMSPRQLERAFDDFFTTKAKGQGLGLSFARRVAEAHDGRIELRSREGRGTDALLYLPTTTPLATGSTPSRA